MCWVEELLLAASVIVYITLHCTTQTYTAAQDRIDVCLVKGLTYPCYPYMLSQTRNFILQHS